MSVGKYSPTVSEAYFVDQEWHDKNCTSPDDIYDIDGYDLYGYNKDGIDRAGCEELDYRYNVEYDGHPLYDDVEYIWTFDGTKPVKK
jgi:hypothetical protein